MNFKVVLAKAVTAGDVETLKGDTVSYEVEFMPHAYSVKEAMDEATKSSARPERTQIQAEENIITDLINTRVLQALVSHSTEVDGEVKGVNGALFLPGSVEYKEGAKAIPAILHAIGVLGPYVYKDSNYALATVNRFCYCGCILDVAGMAVFFSVNCRMSVQAIRDRIGNAAAPKRPMWSETSKVERFRTYSEVGTPAPPPALPSRQSLTLPGRTRRCRSSSTGTTCTKSTPRRSLC